MRKTEKPPLLGVKTEKPNQKLAKFTKPKIQIPSLVATRLRQKATEKLNKTYTFQR